VELISIVVLHEYTRRTLKGYVVCLKLLLSREAFRAITPLFVLSRTYGLDTGFILVFGVIEHLQYNSYLQVTITLSLSLALDFSLEDT
jgi:hypothetical protein